MSNIKKLAGQTFFYGGSSIIARLLNYLLTPYLTAKMTGEGYGEMSLVYAAIPFLNVVFTYGMETAFFRFASQKEHGKDVYNTSCSSILGSTFLLSALLLAAHKGIAGLLNLQAHPEFITYSIVIIALDTLAAMPFSLLRLQGRPIKFATVRILNIFTVVFLTWFFMSPLPKLGQAHPSGIWGAVYRPGYQVGYAILANLFGSLLQLVLLGREIMGFRVKVNTKLWKEMMVYSLPMVIVGFGGMINEVADRLMLGWWAPAATEAGKKEIVGIYSGCYKLSILITLFIQAFRMGAEPFFFKQAEGKDPQRTYARVMKFFVITITVMFLVVALYLDVWKHFLGRPIYWTGLGVVPVLLLANMFLGVYYNLSIWYKITNNTTSGMWITLIGALITFLINYFFIPRYSYYASAWATFLCYFSMMVLSYWWGQKAYPVPYNTKKLIGYFAVVVGMFFLHRWLVYFVPGQWASVGLATVLLLVYVWFLSDTEKRELGKLPVVGKYFMGRST